MIGGMFILFLVLLLLNVPIAFSLGASSLFYLLTSNMNVAVLAQKFYAGIDSFTLLCIPGFMLAGALMNGGGITRRILNFCNAFLGHFTGSLALVNIVASMVFAGISGTAIADVCSLGSMLIPAMVEDGYDDDFSVAVTAASSVVGPIIPPSVPMVIAGSCVSISVGKMFQAGIIPGVLLGLALCVPTYIISVKRHYPKHERSSWKKRLEVTKDAIWALLMPVILLGGILSGIFTPTEASVVTCVYSLIVGVFVYKEIKLSDVPRIVYTNMRSCSSIIILIGLANVFAFILTNERIPQKVATAILSMTTNRILVILLINLVLIFVGMFMGKSGGDPDHLPCAAAGGNGCWHEPGPLCSDGHSEPDDRPDHASRWHVHLHRCPDRRRFQLESLQGKYAVPDHQPDRADAGLLL